MFAAFLDSPSAPYVVVIFGAVSVATGAALLVRRGSPLTSYLRYLWILVLSILAAEMTSPAAGAWILAVLSFWTLREYFSLVEVRIQDRLGILVAYVSIPFMTYFVQIDWYGMFIISIPVYAFLAIPMFVALGGREHTGSVFSIGVIDLGLFLCVYCLGHVAYLISLSTAWATMFVACVAVCDLLCTLRPNNQRGYWSGILARYAASSPLTLVLTFGLSPWTGIPARHNVALALIIPALVTVGRHTIEHMQQDLGIEKSRPRAGHGQILDNLKSVFYTAPVVFHYLRYFVS